MKLQAISILITLLIITAFPGTGFSNDPAEDTPWPIGFNAGEMNISRTLMNSYGDLNGSWLYSVFHAGIDIDATTGSLGCDEVRCVDGGYATIVDWNDIPGTEDEIEWIVIICDELGGTVQNGWSYGHLTEPSFSPYQYVAEGALIGYMHDSVSTPHVHFMWTDWDENEWSYCNPLKYLDPSPTFEDNFVWTFNPDNNDPPFDHFFLENMSYSAWENLTVVETQNLMLDPASLSGNVDFFFGVSLRGDGMPFGGGVGRDDLTSQKIKYDVVRELATGTEILDTRHVFDFDCELNATPGFDSRAQMLYFRHSMDALQFGNDALAYCLTNSNSSEEWDGINNISERYWYTNRIVVSALDTENPVLAKYPDGLYRLDVLCYSFDEGYTFPASVDGVELHNFCPALKEVLVIDSSTDGTYYRAIWEPDASGLLAELNVVSDQPIPAGTELEVILIFTEEMNTETGSVSASLGTSSVSNGNWTSSTVSNDTWTGEVTMPSGSMDETFVLSVSASDTDDNDLMDPEGAGTVPGPSSDTHHSVRLGSGIVLDWSVSVNAPILSSPKLADIDGDGILDVIVQSTDGYVDVLDGSGTSLSGWPVSGGWGSGNPDVKASPAIVNLAGTPSSSPEILAVHPSGCNGFTSSGTTISGWSGINGSEYEWHVMSSPVAGDFSNDGDYEYVLGRQHGSSSSNSTVFYGQEGNGVSIWSKDWGISESLSSTPSICDVDNDGDLEVLAVTDYFNIWVPPVDECGTLYCLDATTGAEEWSYYPVGVFIWGAIATGNLDSDPQMEVIVSSSSGGSVTMVLDGISETPQYSNPTGNVYAGASIGDVDGDGDPDVVVSSGSSLGILHCWDGATGVYLPGFPLSLGTFTRTGVSLGDIDGDGYNEMVLAGIDGKLHAINHDGTEVGGFPVTVSSTALSGQPALGDIDNDGRLEIIFAEQNNSVIHCYEMGENSAYTTLPWPQFQHDAMNTGCFETDISIPAPPTDFDGDGGTSGFYFTANLSWTMSVNDPNFEPLPTPPADVIAYRIYRMIPQISANPIELIATVSAGVESYTDVIPMTGFLPPAICYYATAWDGVNESEETDWVKIPVFGLDNIAAGCPVREIIHSDAIPVSSTHSAILNGTSSIVDLEHRNGCRILTDGEYDAAYIPSGSSDCIEIDLGDICTVRDVNVIRDDISLTNSPRYELSVDGRTFADIDTGRARYIRVYSVAGASEIEVSGSFGEETSALIDIQRGTSGEYRIAAVEAGSPFAVSVFDLSGRSIWQNTSSTGEILWNRCSSSGGIVPAGIYLIMVESDDMETFTAKVVVR